MRILASLLAYTALAMPAFAQSIVDSPEADETRLTIYPDGLGMITELRRITVPKGKATLRFLGVSDQIIPQTAVLQQFEGFSIERNFSRDLISKGSLMQAAVGKTVTISRLDKTSGERRQEEAVIVSAAVQSYGNQRHVYAQPILGVIFSTEQGYEALECSGLPEAIAFSDIPESLEPKPVLSMDVESETAGEREVVITYLSSGLTWEADYRIDVADSHEAGEMLGWLTITNQTSKTFKNVPTAVVAGQLSRSDDTRGDYIATKNFQASCWPRGSTKTGTPVQWPPVGSPRDEYRNRFNRDLGFAAAPAPAMLSELSSDQIVVTASKRQATREDLGDYKLYRTPQPVTVAAHQTKQIAFLGLDDAELERIFEFNFNFDGDVAPQSAFVRYEIDNSKEGNLAQPLPKGTVRVMTKRSNGKTAYLGEDDVDNLAVDLPVKVRISESPSVVAITEARGVTNDMNIVAEHTLHLTGEVYNANPFDIMAEIKLSDEFIRGNNISRATHDRDESETVPTFKFPVERESSEKYDIELPIHQSYVLEENDFRFGKQKAGAVAKTSADALYRLVGDYGNNIWPTKYFKNYVDEDITARAELTDVESFTRNAKVYEERQSYRIEFENEFSRPMPVRYIVNRRNRSNQSAKIIDPSIPPTETDPLVVWDFVLMPKEKKILTYTKVF